jgi:hypothetical protein
VRRTVQAADGATWVVANRWYRRPRLRRLHLHGVDILDAVSLPVDGAGDSATILLGVVVAIAVGVLVVFLLPFVLFVLEVPVVVALVFAIRRRWIVEAVSSGGTRRGWFVRGWLRSRRAVDEVARELELGVEAEPDEALGPA